MSSLTTFLGFVFHRHCWSHLALPHSRGDTHLPPSLAGSVSHLMTGSLAPASRRQYAAELRRFQGFCEMTLHMETWFTASTSYISGYIAYNFIDGYAPSTIQSSLSAISFYHKVLNEPDPVNTYFIQKLLVGAKKSRPSRDIRTPIWNNAVHWCQH